MKKRHGPGQDWRKRETLRPHSPTPNWEQVPLPHFSTPSAATHCSICRLVILWKEGMGPRQMRRARPRKKNVPGVAAILSAMWQRSGRSIPRDICSKTNSPLTTLSLSVNSRIQKKKSFLWTEHIPQGPLCFLLWSYKPPRKAVFPSIAYFRWAEGLSLTEQDKYHQPGR